MVKTEFNAVKRIGMTLRNNRILIELKPLNALKVIELSVLSKIMILILISVE